MSNDAQLSWFKSSYSGSQGDDCVEWARSTAVVYVRDSKDVTVPCVEVSPGAWSAFIARAVRV
ncbi:DUF397 domain-containing protein [Streptomyces sp. Z26]|uniref:DUF397 domain-containing protein n=1 Tax=Streptomyces sp. Z26 TaxID=2500177 RepID=UPI000EF14033|nr:DUF397 domain-containing protein [Streptomyces sp. Z26]RLL66005.1 DUF397 domain-containing protein [Streptomyces sp. Z26]